MYFGTSEKYLDFYKVKQNEILTRELNKNELTVLKIFFLTCELF